MKIAFSFVVVVFVLLGMIATLGHIDGSVTFGEPSVDTTSGIDTSPMTGEEEAYLHFVVSTLQGVSTDISRLGMLFSNPEFENDEWKTAITVLLNRIESAPGAIVPLEPSARLQAFQDASVAAVSYSADFAGLIRVQLQQGQSNLTDDAAIELMAAAEAFGEAEYLFNSFLDEHPIPE